MNTNKKRTLLIFMSLLTLSNLAYSQVTSSPENQPSTPANFEAVLAIIYIASFSIQQLIELIDPFVTPLLAKRISSWNGKIAESDLKKSIIFSLSFLLGLGVCIFGNINLLTWIPTNPNNTALNIPAWMGFGFSAFVIGAGTESVNIAQKYFGYIKENKKNASIITVKIDPENTRVNKNQTLDFKAIIDNTENTNVSWTILESDGGNIDQKTGKYTAPSNPGTYHVRATSAADGNKFSTTSVKVE